jgi:hypothetical protein
MKKFLVVLLTVALLVSISAVSFAAVDMGGNLRVWYKTNVEGKGTPNVSGFQFDRLSLKFGAKLSDNNGFNSEILFGYKNMPADSAFYGVFVNSAYYYQKNLLATDELDIGYIPMSFYYSTDYTSITNGSLANKTCPYGTYSPNADPAKNNVVGAGAVGLKYGFKTTGFEAALAVTNAVDGDIKDYASCTGVEEALFVKIMPMKNLTIGLGYLNDNGTKNNIVDSASDTYAVADVTYVFDPVKVFFEYYNKTPNGLTAQSGMYLEGTVKLMDTLSAYLGGSIGTKDNGALIKATNASEYYNAGVVFQMAPKTALQAEYVTYPDSSDGNSFNVRLKVDF